VPGQAAIEVDPHAPEDQGPPLDQAMSVVTDPDAHG
jgi:hypothetical protein